MVEYGNRGVAGIRGRRGGRPVETPNPPRPRVGSHDLLSRPCLCPCLRTSPEYSQISPCPASQCAPGEKILQMCLPTCVFQPPPPPPTQRFTASSQHLSFSCEVCKIYPSSEALECLKVEIKTAFNQIYSQARKVWMCKMCMLLSVLPNHTLARGTTANAYYTPSTFVSIADTPCSVWLWEKFAQPCHCIQQWSGEATDLKSRREQRYFSLPMTEGLDVQRTSLWSSGPYISQNVNAWLIFIHLLIFWGGLYVYTHIQGGGFREGIITRGKFRR